MNNKRASWFHILSGVLSVEDRMFFCKASQRSRHSLALEALPLLGIHYFCAAGTWHQIHFLAAAQGHRSMLNQIQTEQATIVILYEDTDLLAVDKPAGLVVHPAYKHPDGTLFDAVRDYLHERGEARPCLLHRLDKDTSGALLLTKTDQARQRLVRALEQHALTKQYLGLVCGQPVPASGQIRARLRRDPTDRLRMQIHPAGAESLTRYQTLRAFTSGFSLLTLQPITGRTHQLRVHLAALGTPLAGDHIYGAPTHWAPLHTPRHLLHAHLLAFQHPTTNERLTITAPMPAEMQEALEACAALE
jgi:23S rRNA pseudouridine1911/1915/1917 synthase